jgi:hypothetical protein
VALTTTTFQSDNLQDDLLQQAAGTHAGSGHLRTLVSDM